MASVLTQKFIEMCKHIIQISFFLRIAEMSIEIKFNQLLARIDHPNHVLFVVK